MPLTLPAKVAAFCRELSDPALEELAAANGEADAFRRASQALAATTPATVDAARFEADLDALEALARRCFGQGFYPADLLSYSPPPGASAVSGARYWACPVGRCQGRGRVRSGQSAPVCSGHNQPLVSRPVEA